MADDVEVEDFEITDYDLMEGMGLGFRRRKMTREDAIYGIWADRDSDDDDRPSFSGKRKKDYTKPLNFVSGGVVQKGKDKKTEDDDAASVGSSASEKGPGSGRNSPVVRDKKLFKGTGVKKETGPLGPQMFAKKLLKTSGKEFGSFEKYTKGFGMKMLQQMGYEPGKGLGKDGQGIVYPVEAFKREGRGALGSYGPERSKKAQEYSSSKLRPVYDEEEDEEEKFREQLQQWKKTEEGYSKPKYVYKTVDEVKATGGSKKGPSISLKHSKIKVVDMTGPETKILTGYGSIAQQHAKPGEVPPTTSVRDAEAAFAMPELTYNLNLLIDMAETDIVQTDRQLKFEQDLVVNLKHEEEKLSAVLEREEKEIKKLMEVINMIDRESSLFECHSCRQQSLSPDDDVLTLDKCEEIFNTLQEDYYEEFKMYDLASLAEPLVFSLVRKYFEGWNPLVNPSHGLEVMVRWREILERKEAENSAFSLTLAQGTAHGEEAMKMYDRLVWEVWMPFLRSVICSWTCREYESMLNLINIWIPVLPQWILENIKQQLILPRLQVEVDAWNPLTDTVPVHAWIHPWLPLMGDRLEPLYAPIRFKLASALTNWHPSDPSAKMMLEPWSKSRADLRMAKETLERFFQRYNGCIHSSINLTEIVAVLGRIHYKPSPAALRAFSLGHGVGGHHNAAAFHQFVRKTFLSSLDSGLYLGYGFVCSSLVNRISLRLQYVRKALRFRASVRRARARDLYSGWKGMFSDDLLNHPTIKVQFNRALDVMNQAVTSPGGVLQPGARENIAYLTSTERRREAEAAAMAAAVEKQKAEAARTLAASQNVPSNFKDLIQNLAEENNLIFMPTPNRRFEGKALYSLGKVTLYIDRGVVFVNTQGVWKPVSLQDLISLAK
ncbi:Tuftelin-interacting protein 11 [Stylophora pistillata]|uniref:Tuftelin-interacting protein 11 n=1 Tax=Stylophora pistillata TaxID=50429 RepID=A0A2B4SQ57_STYPI|nr:Tuftelin-interacting protein 11 [Stylophora pistillata]